MKQLKKYLFLFCFTSFIFTIKSAESPAISSGNSFKKDDLSNKIETSSSINIFFTSISQQNQKTKKALEQKTKLVWALYQIVEKIANENLDKTCPLHKFPLPIETFVFKSLENPSTEDPFKGLEISNDKFRKWLQPSGPNITLHRVCFSLITEIQGIQVILNSFISKEHRLNYPAQIISGSTPVNELKDILKQRCQWDQIEPILRQINCACSIALSSALPEEEKSLSQQWQQWTWKQKAFLIFVGLLLIFYTNNQIEAALSYF
jgi:hypothetical protein